ncbi:hypothetical protein E8E11_010136 [Didymella keratinophila]|nr:hypothetical protein E8E11_010136 [Didymella keratinophila]
MEDSNAITAFFSMYPKFVYNDKWGVAEEFYRVCDYLAWKRDDEAREEALYAFKDAMIIRFNGLYGTDITNIKSWHRRCVAVRIKSLPATIVKCKEI